jgi:hypothetical protein
LIVIRGAKNLFFCTEQPRASDVSSLLLQPLIGDRMPLENLSPEASYIKGLADASRLLEDVRKLNLTNAYTTDQSFDILDGLINLSMTLAKSDRIEAKNTPAKSKKIGL